MENYFQNEECRRLFEDYTPDEEFNFLCEEGQIPNEY